ncbi:MAG TPA: chemotaxis protein CheW, partial [Candidatus Binatia bacterium]
MTMGDALTSEQIQYLTFHLGGEEYAIGILRVKEIIE